AERATPAGRAERAVIDYHRPRWCAASGLALGHHRVVDALSGDPPLCTDEYPVPAGSDMPHRPCRIWSISYAQDALAVPPHKLTQALRQVAQSLVAVLFHDQPATDRPVTAVVIEGDHRERVGILYQGCHDLRIGRSPAELHRLHQSRIDDARHAV